MAEAAELAERLSEAEEQLGQLSALADERDRALRASAEEVERVRTELRAQAKQLASLLNQAVRRADEREEQVVVLRRQLDQVEQAARGARIGLDIQAVRLERELERIRARLAVKVLGGAKELLLPPGSVRRAVYDRVLALTSHREPTLELVSASAIATRRLWSSTSRRQFRSLACA